MVLPHFRERVDESPRQDENFGTFGLSLSFFVSELRPFKVKDKFFQCIFEALFINSANALLLTAVGCQQGAEAGTSWRAAGLHFELF